jgi:hypothetical protein
MSNNLVNKNNLSKEMKEDDDNGNED